MIDALVSVVIPAYNAEKYIESAIQSVLDQSYQNIEIIVVNDGSRDKTSSLIDRYENQVRVINQESSGVSSARNNGIRHAIGRYIAFLDADDTWSRTKIEKQVTVLQRYPEVAVCRTRIELVNDSYKYNSSNNNSAQEVICEIESDFGSHFRNPYLGTSSIMMRSSVIKKHKGFDESLKTAEDVDLFLRVLYEFPCLANIGEKLVQKRVIEGSLGDNFESYVDNLYVIKNFVARNPTFESQNKRLVASVTAYIYMRYGEELLWRRKYHEARSVLVISLTNYFSLKVVFLLIKTFVIPVFKK